MNHSSDSALAFDLTAFEAAMRADPSVLGLLYSGSLGRGTADRYSDLDLELWVSDDTFAETSSRARALLEQLGTVQFAIFRPPASTRGFVGGNWRRVDLNLWRRADLRPNSKYADAHVVKDTDGVLAQLVASSPQYVEQPSLLQMRESIEEAIDSQIYLSLHNARGAIWSAAGEAGYRLAELYTALAQLRGRRSCGFRYVEVLLSAHEQDLLAAARPTSVEQGEVRRAARALWVWTRYVWAEAERVLGYPLALAFDDDALLSAVDCIYE